MSPEKKLLDEIMDWRLHRISEISLGASGAMPGIIVATDGSPGADRAVDAAAELAKATGSSLMILTIGGDLSGGELRELASVEGDLSKELETAVNNILDAARERALRKGLSDVTLRSGWGDPAETIIDTIQRENADILVVGRRGHGRLSGLLLGSISQKMTSLAPCTVMVVP